MKLDKKYLDFLSPFVCTLRAAYRRGKRDGLIATQAELAKLCGCSTMMISYLMHGKKSASKALIDKLANALQTKFPEVTRAQRRLDRAVFYVAMHFDQLDGFQRSLLIHLSQNPLEHPGFDGDMP